MLFKPVKETTWREVADRAKVLNEPSSARGARHMAAFSESISWRRKKNQSTDRRRVSSCLGPSSLSSKSKKQEKKVALKFMADDEAVRREVEKREAVTRNDATAKDSVVLVKAAFTADPNLDVPSVKFEKDFKVELAQYEGIYLNPSEDDSTATEICHVLVMNCGSGQDLSDVLSHQDIA